MTCYVKETDRFGNVYYYDNKFNLHRRDCPAFINNVGDEEWCINNKLHRKDGHAVEKSNGYKAWYIHNILIYETKMDFKII